MCYFFRGDLVICLKKPEYMFVEGINLHAVFSRLCT
jgi:hypothetical protein